MTATQDDTIAELQRTIAELRQELGERDAALAQHKSDFDERIEHQAATIDVLKAMSASPGDPQPVFDLITTRARELCGSVASMLGCASNNRFKPARPEVPESTLCRIPIRNGRPETRRNPLP